jgi:hypothetical protein
VPFKLLKIRQYDCKPKYRLAVTLDADVEMKTDDAESGSPIAYTEAPPAAVADSSSSALPHPSSPAPGTSSTIDTNSFSSSTAEDVKSIKDMKSQHCFVYANGRCVSLGGRFSLVYIKSNSVKIIEPKHHTLTDILEYYNLACFAGMVTPFSFIWKVLAARS